MKTETTPKKILLELKGYDYRQEGENRRIYATELRNAEVGDIWKSDAGGLARDRLTEKATLIYKDRDGFALKIKSDYYTDSSKLEETIRLVWVPLADVS